MTPAVEPIRKVQFLPRPNALRHRWTPNELAVLKEHYPNGGTSRVIEMLPRRGPDTIRAMAHKLSVKKRPYIAPPKSFTVGETVS